MELKIIGTGSSGNAYVLENEKEALLIEAGIRFSEIKKALDFNVQKVAGCIVSHSHGDHAKSINDVMKAGINVYASPDTYSNCGIMINHKTHFLYQGATYSIGGFKILPFEVKHDVHCLGFLISHEDCGKVLFLTDTYYCEYKFKDLNNIIIEANYCKDIIDRKFGPDSKMEFLRNRILRSHFSIAHCKEMLSANDLSKVNNIVLIHLSDSNSDERQFKSEVEQLTGKNVNVASNGMRLKFDKTPF